MAAVDIGSRQLHVARRGSGDPLLLIPGLAATSGFWGEPFLDALAANLHVIAYDHRGIGASSPSQGAFSIADAYFAPVCMRLKTYALPVPAAIADYVQRVCELPGVAAWIAGALAEHDFLDFEEPYRLKRS